MKNIKWAKFSAFQMTIEGHSSAWFSRGAHCAPLMTISVKGEF